ncbi:LacI family transcriptional regulator [Pedobacter sp. HDW13]|uniref:LacI family DNA-binding transcriptional regulator n=1 Tax=Pedobacter sp. HDW13 TaxID=2714940 RepID=UPI00140785EC|nr:LacI family transcriptional regulator [Pedobacter sp. HDW13]
MAVEPITLKILAYILGTSISAVSRSLTDHKSISLKTRFRVKDLAEKMGYWPSPVARAFKKGNTSIPGLIAPDFKEIFFQGLLRRYIAQCIKVGIPLWCSSPKIAKIQKWR